MRVNVSLTTNAKMVLYVLEITATPWLMLLLLNAQVNNFIHDKATKLANFKLKVLSFYQRDHPYIMSICFLSFLANPAYQQLSTFFCTYLKCDIRFFDNPLIYFTHLWIRSKSNRAHFHLVLVVTYSIMAKLYILQKISFQWICSNSLCCNMGLNIFYLRGYGSCQRP